MRRLLEDTGLPTADLCGSHRVRFLAVGSASAPHGVVGLECFGTVGLLRSLAVPPASRGQGLGKALVAAVEHAAGQSGVRRLFLLTTTAQAFFAALGYVPTDRDQIPEAIRATAEFSTLCPSTAVVLVKAVSRAPSVISGSSDT